MKLLKSLEELLYEVVSWLLFYPLTMLRSVVKPLIMMRYADIELADRQQDQYEDSLSPPLFLLITLLLSQGLSGLIPSIYDPSEGARELGSGSNLLMARAIIFGIYPLCMAVMLLWSKSIRITRNSLRKPFFQSMLCCSAVRLHTCAWHRFAQYARRGRLVCGPDCDSFGHLMVCTGAGSLVHSRSPHRRHQSMCHLRRRVSVRHRACVDRCTFGCARFQEHRIGDGLKALHCEAKTDPR